MILLRSAGFNILLVYFLNSKMVCDNIDKPMSKYMEEALKEASKALLAGDVPVGCVIEKDGHIIGRGHNRVEELKDPTAHAETEAIKNASAALGSERLTDCRMYVTLEPCAMCAGAIVLARISELIIGTQDPKTGACGSLYNITEDDRLNHRTKVTTGVMQKECAKILKDFFRKIRKEKRGK
jgi:tRNA(adenine34) deaminase